MPGLLRSIVIVRSGKPIAWANTRGEALTKLKQLPANALPEIKVWSVYHVSAPTVSHDDTGEYVTHGEGSAING